MLDAMMAVVFVLLGAVAACFITVAAVGFIRMGSASDGMCAPSRRANITASKPQARRRVMVQLGPPAGWREPAIAPAAVAYAAPTPEQIAAAVDLERAPATRLRVDKADRVGVEHRTAARLRHPGMARHPYLRRVGEGRGGIAGLCRPARQQCQPITAWEVVERSRQSCEGSVRIAAKRTPSLCA